MRYLVVMDVPGIKEYVFGTDRLVEIRGASALLDNLNRIDMPAFIEGRLGGDKVDCVFSGGGGGQFIITADRNDLDRCMMELQALFTRISKGGVRLLTGVAQLSGATYALALEKAFLELTKEKEEIPFIPCTQLHTGYLRECESCSGMASVISSYGSETSILCNACVEKVRYGAKKRGLWKGFAQFLHGKGIQPDVSGVLRPVDFEEIGERCLARKGYTGLVYADGNAMGKLVKKIQTRQQFRFFSITVDQSIREACHEALHENCPEIRGKIPADILLLGGDDLLVYLSAENALPFSISAARKFLEKTKERFSTYTEDSFFEETLKGKGLSISIGIAYGKSHTPFSIMFNQAEELLASAKEAGSKAEHRDFFSPSYIDYHLAVHFNQLKVGNSRKDHLTIEREKPLLLYRKPYSLDDAQALLWHARDLVGKRIPRSRLKRLGVAPSLGKINGMLECMKVFSRTRGKEQRLAIWKALDRFGCAVTMPWFEGPEHDATSMVDLIELTDFVAGDHLKRRRKCTTSSNLV